MKKSKVKSEKKSPKKDNKKDVKKAAQKELGSSLSAKFKEVIEGLGHEAEVIAKDIEKASKFLSKKISVSGKKAKKDAASSSLIKTLDSAIEEVREKHQDAVEKPVKVESTPAKAQPVNTRRRATAAKSTETPEVEKTKTSPARKPTTDTVKASTPTTAKRGGQREGATSKKNDRSEATDAQKVETTVTEQNEKPSTDTMPPKEETKG
jgi:hypothetical protein